jgi:1,4-alpha-glucan branching enzyme
MIKELNHFYHAHNALWENDFESRGFEWVDFADQQNCVISYLRKGTDKILLCIHNFLPSYHPDYIVNVKNVRQLHEVFNSDAEKYSGSGKHTLKPVILHDHSGYPYGVQLQLAPLATMIFEINFN